MGTRFDKGARKKDVQVNMKHILIVMTSLYNGGAERSLVNFLNELPYDKYQVDLLLFMKRGIFLNQLPKEVNVLETPKELTLLYGYKSKGGHLWPIKYIGSAISKIFTCSDSERRAFRWKYFYSKVIPCMNKEYDIALGYMPCEIIYYLDEKVMAKKKIGWVHNDYISSKYPYKYDKPHFARLDALVSISDTCVDILKRTFPEFRNKIYCLHNITSSRVIHKLALEFFPSEYKAKKINLISIGRLHKQKGFDIAVKAASLLKQKKIEFNWFIIGGGNEGKRKLEELIKVEDVSDCVKLLGIRENPYPYIRNANVFVQSSRYEGKSVVLDEAKILAIPIVATNYPTVNDQIKSDCEGMIVPLNPQGLADGIELMISDSKLSKRFVDYLNTHEYGNQDEIFKYISLMES